MDKTANKAPSTTVEPTFHKEQILKSNLYQHQRDLLSALLEDEKEYSHAEIERIIDNYMKGKVK